ncbi:unnamed protein product [Dicrocoelium dendriticum]|nr:unnamed protein product [Dicrocoelium dendriticum]
MLGLLSKLSEVRLHHGSDAYYFSAITKTRLPPDISDRIIALPGMSRVRHGRPSNGGEVALYFHKDLQWELIEDPVNVVQGSPWCRLRLKGDGNCLVVVIYRPTSSTPEVDSHLASATRRVLNTNFSHIHITDDFNIHALESQAAYGEQFKVDLQKLVSSYPKYGLSNTHTRFREEYAPSILVRIFTNQELMVEKVAVDVPLSRNAHALLLRIHSL